MSTHSKDKIAVLDFGGQYAHLIASRVRRLGTYSEIRSPDDLTADELSSKYSGLILSGGPASVYGEGAPRSRPELLEVGLPVLGICYGHQLMMLQRGGEVRNAGGQEFGPAQLEVISATGLLSGENGVRGTVWMSHGDEVVALPAGFEPLARTADCAYAAVADLERRHFGLQFHPEVRHTERGDHYLRNFLRICGVENTWDLGDFLQDEIEKIRKQVVDRKVFFLVSGGVDSTVAFALLAKALPPDHLKGLFVDTGFMRLEEGVQVRAALREVGVELEIADASDRYFSALRGVYEPEEKRRIIGELFVRVQADFVKDMGLDPDEWYLGQGTIYPDTIESGATKHSHRIKTHHNRVPAIEELLARGRVVEPLRELYKDEVRRLGSLLGLPEALVMRHPFPGPGLAVRCLCAGGEPEFSPEEHALQQKLASGKIPELESVRPHAMTATLLPLHSVGVQGDQRSYARSCALIGKAGDWPDWATLKEIGRRLPNRYRLLNRVLLCSGAKERELPERLEARFPVDLNRERIERLRVADRIVHDFQVETGLYDAIWQFPTVLVPVGLPGSMGEAIILRPIISSDAMTAAAFEMSFGQIQGLTARLLKLDGIDLVFYDLTSKPPGTIEWE
ncbi:MAG: glutamine-hydrolyzing GMP synthase [Spirochaetales bacterium]|nr:glutamine-hydrolyzing GMP synthase [Leptospiraceae bacterium]MCP5480897.1 glutamine-hydrolyzing GMP synthase [Spirochaetales bacterium]MCP5485277.1 glutamine-hydrolyzing GMP synthase [Spirochaetales bacterium]